MSRELFSVRQGDCFIVVCYRGHDTWYGPLTEAESFQQLRANGWTTPNGTLWQGPQGHTAIVRSPDLRHFSELPTVVKDR
jgi:hypothetical protein